MSDADDDLGAAGFGAEDAELDDLGLGAEEELPDSEGEEAGEADAEGSDAEEAGEPGEPGEPGEEADPLAARPTDPAAPPHFDALVHESNCKAEIVFITGAARLTSDWLSQGEAAGLLSLRAAQIADGSPILVEGPLPPGCDDSVKIAYRELLGRRCPLEVHRVVNTVRVGGVLRQYVEVWYPNEMKHLPMQPPS